MKVSVEYEGKKVEITLTAEQEAEVKQKAFDYKSLKTIGDVFSYLGMNYQTWLEQQKTWGREDHSIAYDECTLIAKAINGGFWLDGKDDSVHKYYPIHRVTSSGLGFSYYDCSGWRSRLVVGSRLCVSDLERSEYAGKQFIETYKRHKIL